MYTQEQKNIYFKNLREDWKKSKEIAEKDLNARTLYEQTGLTISFYSFHYVLTKMLEKNLEGIPYIDCKTFKGWQENGFKVKKGEKSIISGITWVMSKSEEEDGAVPKFPKLYHLFHKNQVEPIKIS